MNAYLLFFLSSYIILCTIYGLHKDILDLDGGEHGYTLGLFILAVSLNAIVMPCIIPFMAIRKGWERLGISRKVVIRPKNWFKKKVAPTDRLTSAPVVNAEVSQEYINSLLGNIEHYQRFLGTPRINVTASTPNPDYPNWRGRSVSQTIAETERLQPDMSRVRPSIRIED